MMNILLGLGLITLLVSDCAAGKSGYCPTVHPDTVGICLAECDVTKFDEDCKGTKKCCSNGCGHTCQEPVETKEMLVALNSTVVFDIPYTTVAADKPGFKAAVKNALETGYTQFFVFKPSNVYVSYIVPSMMGNFTDVNLWISQGNETNHDFSVYSGELKTNIQLGQLKVQYKGQTISQLKAHSGFFYVYEPVDDTPSGQGFQGVNLSLLLIALLALLYLL